ncbi:MAG: thrombospondin type 3 repeat-containing protein, partial [Proteobacteria bacterium]|nr:thrombospondin type 3 repeat-containing protein [Pseudomonadota bacterium]
DSLTYPTFPSDTSRSINASGNEIAASPTNFSGLTGTINLPGVDPDDDGDGVPNDADLFPNDPSESADADNDGIGDNADTDDDNDGVPDSSDAFPTDSTRTVDPDSVNFKYRSPINYFQGIDEYNNLSILQVSSMSDQVNKIKLALFDENGTTYDYATVMGSGFTNHLVSRPNSFAP